MTSLQRKQASRNRSYLPTQEEIRRACGLIQAAWSPRERAKRYLGSYEPWWMPPSYRLPGLLQTIHEEPVDRLP